MTHLRLVQGGKAGPAIREMMQVSIPVEYKFDPALPEPHTYSCIGVHVSGPTKAKTAERLEIGVTEVLS